MYFLVPPTKPPNFNRITPLPPFLFTSDEEEEDDEYGNVDYEGISEAQLQTNQNPNPEDIRPANTRVTGFSPIFPMASRASNLLPHHPSDPFISYEMCTEEERQRLIRNIEDVENECSILINNHCNSYIRFAEYRKKERQMYENVGVQSENQMLKALAKSRNKIKNAKKRNENRQRQQMNELYMRRRAQNFFSLELQAVVTGIQYRNEHPDETFVIYLSDGSLSLQRVQPQSDNAFLPATPAPHATTPHDRFPRGSTETNHLHILDPEEIAPSCPAFNYPKFVPFNATFVISHAETVFDFIHLMDNQSRIILTTKFKNIEKMIEMKNGMTDLFYLFKSIVGGWFKFTYYNNLIETQRDFDMLDKLITDSKKTTSIKMDIMILIKDTILARMGTNLKWYYKPLESTNLVHLAILDGIQKLI